MKHLVPAKKLIAELIEEERIEVRGANPVSRDLAALIEKIRRPPSGRELEEWLESHRLVTEVYVSARDLDDLVYRHITPEFAEPEVLREARHDELEQEIRRAPGNADAYMVYSDYLQESSDPLGQLIAYGVAAANGNDDDSVGFERHLKKHRARFLEDIAGYVPSQIELHWRYGFVQRITEITRIGEDVWKKLLELRVCSFVETIRVVLSGYGHGTSNAATLAAIAEHASKSLSHVSLSGFYELVVPETIMQRNISKLVLSGGQVSIPDVFPESLEILHLEVADIKSPGDKPPRWNIRHLEVLFRESVAEFLSFTALNRVEHLALSLEEFDHSQRPFLHLFRELELPALTHLKLSAGRIPATSLSDMSTLPIAQKLRSLALEDLWLTDDHAQDIATHLPRFGSLEEIDVTGNELTRQGLAALQAVVPSVVSRRQNKPGTAAHARLRQLAGSRWWIANTIKEPGRWRRSGIDGDLRWARYQGSDEYELFVTRDLSRYGCTCPSDYQPCKHVVALALVDAEHGLKTAPADGIEQRVASHYRFE